MVAPLLVAAAVAATLASPLWLLLLAPIVLGTPHLAADLRYLVLRGPLRGTAGLAIGLLLAAMTLLRAAGAFEPRLEVALGCAAVAVAARRAWLVLAIPAIAYPQATILILLHGHNAIALAIWLRWTRGGPARGRGRVIALALAATVAIAAGACDAWIPHAGPLDARALARTLAPGLGPTAAGRIVLLYALWQALHYVAWLWLIPRSRRTGTTLRHDFGRAGLAMIAATAIAVPVLAVVGDAARVRDVYLSLVVFHAWLELAVIARLVAMKAPCLPG